MRGDEELEKTAVSRKPFRELSCNSNVRTNLVPEDERIIMKRIVCVKLEDDIHNPKEMNCQVMGLKEHVNARYRLSDQIRAQKNDKMTNNLSNWIRTGPKRKGTWKKSATVSKAKSTKTEIIYSITQLMGWWHAREKMKRIYYTSTISS